MFCKKCGMRLSDGARFCKRCGEATGKKESNDTREDIFNEKNEDKKNFVKNSPKDGKNKRPNLFLWIVLLLILFITVICIVKRNEHINKATISEIKWIQILSENFEIQDKELMDAGSDSCTGKYAAMTIVQLFGKKNINFLSGLMNVDEEQAIEFALQNGIVKKKQLDNSITEEEAQEILENAMDFYHDVENYPEYYDVNYVCDVVYTDDWDISSFDEVNGVLYTSAVERAPIEGQVLLIKNKYGIAKPRYIKEVLKRTEGQYELVLEKLTEPSELYDEIAFSGKADFSYLLNIEGEKSSNEYIDNNMDTAKDSNNMFMPVTVYAAETKMVSVSVDIETGGEFKAGIKSNGEQENSYESYIKLTDGENEAKYSVDIDNEKNLTLTLVRNDVTLKAEKKADEAKMKAVEAEKEETVEQEVEKNKTESGLETEIGGSLLYNVKISDLQIAASYCSNGRKEDEFIDIKVSCDTELATSISGSFEGKIPIAKLEVPIAGTGGLASIDLQICLVVDVSGKVTLMYEMVDISWGVNASSDGLLVSHSRNRDADRLNLQVKADMGFGLSGEATLTIGDWVDAFEYEIVNPSIDVMIEGKTEILESNEGFEQYPQCIQLTAGGPTVTFEVSSEDSLIHELLDSMGMKVELTYDFITIDEAPFKKEYHIETELDGTVNTITGSKECCTHVKLGESVDEDVDLSSNPEATEDELKAKEKHFYGVVLQPEDVVLKMFDALQDGDYELAAECLDPGTEQQFDFWGGIASSIIGIFTGEYISWGQLVLEVAGATDVDVIECYSQNMLFDSNMDLFTELIPQIPGIRNLICTEADVYVKYRYKFADEYYTTEEIYRVRRYEWSGWRIEATR